MLIRLLPAALCLAALLLELTLVLASPQALLVAVVFVWFAAPGPATFRRLFGPAETSGAAWLIGPMLGLSASTLALLLAWTLRLPPWLALAVSPLPAWLYARRGTSPLADVVAFPRLTARDLSAVCLLGLTVPLITTVPYARIAEILPDGGRAYRAYFTADFVWAMSVSAELAKEVVPPANPFLHDGGLNYYWLSHLLSGADYRFLGAFGVRLEDVILINAIGFGLVFLACLFGLARTLGLSADGAAVGVAAGFLANSYEGIERIRNIQGGGLDFDWLRVINIDAVSRWYYQGMPVDGLQRLFLYQPHHLTGYALALFALWLVARAHDIRRAAVPLAAGVLLGASFLFSTFTAIIVGAAVGGLYVWRVVAAHAWRSLVIGGLLAGGPVAVAIALSIALGYVPVGQGSLMHLVVNPVAFHRWPIVLLLNFGPLILVGGAGLVAGWATRAAIAPLVALTVAAWLFYFFADVPDMGGVWVGWRAGHLLLIAFALLTGVAIDTLRQRGGPIRWAGLAAIAVLFAVALPTVAIDVYNAQDVENEASMPLFPWTLVLSPAEQEGLSWIRTHTPPEAIVQVEAQARNAGTWAYIPAFAERRMYAGLPISMIPLRPYQLATDSVLFGIYRAPSAKDAWEMAHFLDISYLVFGAPERERYRDVLAMLEQDSGSFARVFENDALTVLQVVAH